RTFIDVQTQAVRRFNRIVHVYFGIAVFPVENFEKKSEIVRACRTQSKIFDRSDLLFESGPQFLFLERLLAAKFNDAGLLRAFFLLLHDCPPLFLSLFWSHNIDALRCDVGCKNHCAENGNESRGHSERSEAKSKNPVEISLGIATGCLDGARHDIDDGISAKTNQIFEFSPKIPMNSDVTSEHNLVGDLEAYGCLLLTSAGINRSQIQIQPVEDCVAVGWLAFFNDFTIELVDPQH